MTDEMVATTQGATASSFRDEELSSLLGRGNPASEHAMDPIGVEADCFPLDGVDAAYASARAGSEALRARSADLAREVLAQAEHEVRDLLAQDPLAADWSDRSGDIVARAQRQVGEILTQGRNDAGVLELRTGQRAADLRAETDALACKRIESDDQPFATLRAVALPSEAGALRYRVSGQLTLATMLAFQYAVSRLPGVDSARVDPEPKDVAVLSMMTNDSTLVHRQLERMAGVRLEMDPA